MNDSTIEAQGYDAFCAATKTVKPKFELGEIVATAGALDQCAALWRWQCLARHASGDWGNVGKADAAANDTAVRDGTRILSAYPLDPDKPSLGRGANTLWIITEADRSVTTFLLPDEY